MAIMIVISSFPGEQWTLYLEPNKTISEWELKDMLNSIYTRYGLDTTILDGLLTDENNCVTRNDFADTISTVLRWNPNIMMWYNDEFIKTIVDKTHTMSIIERRAAIQKIIDKAPRGEQWEKGDRGMKMGKKLAGGIHGKGFAHGKGMGFGIADADLAEARAAALGTTVADLKQDFADGKKFSDILDEANLTPAQYHEHLIDELEDLVNKNGIDAKKKQFYTNMIKRLKAKQS